MQKIFITGAGGFIGSHLVEKCVEMGNEVVAFIHYNSRNSWGWLESSEYKNKVKIILGDIRDYDSVSQSMRGCDTIFHLAALIGIPYSYVSPQAYIKTNIDGTYNVIEAARHQNVSNIMVTSTSETYGTAQYVPIDEKHPMVGQSPYSATKIAADHLALSYYLSFDLPIKIVRPFNTYGPRQSARAIIPNIISQILAGKTKLSLGNIDPTRDLTFVKDTVNGFIAISETEAFNGQIVNVGMQEEISIKELAKLIAGIMGKEVEIEQTNERQRPEKSEVRRLFCNNEKLKKHSGWKPEYTLEQGLAETIEWLSAHQNLYKPEIYAI